MSALRKRSMFRIVCAITSLAFVLPLAYCQLQKFRLDHEVDRLCAIDGGVHIYESINLPAENFGPSGEIFPQYKHLFMNGGDLGPEYYSIVENKVLVSKNPALQRLRVAVGRKCDGKVLGEFIDYKRSGGDLPGPWEPSHRSCPQAKESGNFYRLIFKKEDR